MKLNSEMSDESVNATVYARPDKEEPIEVLTYEITMLDYCYQQIQLNWKTWSREHKNIFLEAYLLHFRNLIEFFCPKKRPKTRKRSQKLHVWEPGRWISNIGVDKRAVEMTNDESFAENWDDISEYLQHCTVRRSEQKHAWPIARMHQGLEPTIDQFVAEFSPKLNYKKTVTRGQLPGVSMSTES